MERTPLLEIRWVVWHPEETYETVLGAEKARVGEGGGEWQYRLLGPAARYSLNYIREFDEPLPVVGETNERNLTVSGGRSRSAFAAEEQFSKIHLLVRQS